MKIPPEGISIIFLMPHPAKQSGRVDRNTITAAPQAQGEKRLCDRG